MLVKLAYGDSGLKVEFPDLITDVVEPEYVPGLPDEPAAIQSAFEASTPVGIKKSKGCNFNMRYYTPITN